jgi:hypothetical protein
MNLILNPVCLAFSSAFLVVSDKMNFGKEESPQMFRNFLALKIMLVIFASACLPSPIT